jgi:lysophospholipase L1-like esterase
MKNCCSRLPLLLLVLLFSAVGVFAEPAKKQSRPELLPITDTPGLPRVLLIGDTVSIAYTLPTRKFLEGTANLHRHLSNSSSSQLGAEQVSEWLGTAKWDVIHFNFGAYDLALTKEGAAEVPLARYEANLHKIVALLRTHSPHARLIFATTTPIPEAAADAPLRFATKDAQAYAAIALKVMNEAKVRINDLHALVQPRVKELQLANNLHFRSAGNEVLARQVADSILAALKESPQKVLSPVPSQKGLRVYTAGHSFHVWLIPLLREIALTAGIPDHQIAGASRIGGSTVLKHWNVPDAENTAKQLLRAGQADVLTLSPIWLPDEGIGNFAKLAVEHNPSIRITVQKYWLPNDEFHPVYPLETRKKVDHNATSIPALQEAQDQYDRQVDDYVRAINAELGKNAIVTVPVGQAVVKLREKIVAGLCPGIEEQAELFRDSWGHPTQPIMALAGYCHFAVIYQRSAVGLPRPTILTRNDAWDDKLNRLLQELAWEAVKEHPMSGVKIKP